MPKFTKPYSYRIHKDIDVFIKNKSVVKNWFNSKTNKKCPQKNSRDNEPGNSCGISSHCNLAGGECGGNSHFVKNQRVRGL